MVTFEIASGDETQVNEFYDTGHGPIILRA
jgi:hypothetical protein